jgi:hypothetical protein
VARLDEGRREVAAEAEGKEAADAAEVVVETTAAEKGMGADTLKGLGTYILLTLFPCGILLHSYGQAHPPWDPTPHPPWDPPPLTPHGTPPLTGILFHSYGQAMREENKLKGMAEAVEYIKTGKEEAPAFHWTIQNYHYKRKRRANGNRKKVWRKWDSSAALAPPRRVAALSASRRPRC